MSSKKAQVISRDEVEMNRALAKLRAILGELEASAGKGAGGAAAHSQESGRPRRK